MIQELLDMLDETLQDLDEAGFPDEAEQLYRVAYDTEWESERDMVGEIGMSILRLQSHQEGELPQTVVARLARCMELIRRVRPDVSLE